MTGGCSFDLHPNPSRRPSPVPHAGLQQYWVSPLGARLARAPRAPGDSLSMPCLLKSSPKPGMNTSAVTVPCFSACYSLKLELRRMPCGPAQFGRVLRASRFRTASPVIRKCAHAPKPGYQQRLDAVPGHLPCGKLSGRPACHTVCLLKHCALSKRATTTRVERPRRSAAPPAAAEIRSQC